MRMDRLTIGLVCLWAYIAPALADAHTPTRQELVGMWRLLSIDLSGVDGHLTDPFYQANSSGVIVYDASGSMSVQIAGPHRIAAALPTSRLHPATGAEAVAKAGAFDSYYAYFGTWTYDAAASAVTHHVESSLLPAEIGVDYVQEVSVEGDRLTFTNRDPNHGKPTVRIKIWQRVSTSGDSSGR
jgi:hypothetical protein